MMAKISVIVPIYNVEKFLRRCIDSILAQTFTDFELLLIDDGSKDGSGKICDGYANKDSRVRVFHKPNGGLTSARNHGLLQAKGDWIAHIDGDDWVEPDYFEKLMSIANDKEADIVFCDSYFDYPDKSIVQKHYDWKASGNEALNEFIASTWTCIWGSIQRRSLYSKHNLYSPIEISYCEDFHLIVRLCYFAENIAKVNQPLYHYRQQNGSIMHNLNKKTEADEQWAYSDIISFFKEKGVYGEFEKTMAWRSLKASQELVLDPTTFEKFLSYNPDKTPFILSCPFIGVKLKFMMWCLTHRLGFITRTITTARKLLKK